MGKPAEMWNWLAGCVFSRCIRLDLFSKNCDRPVAFVYICKQRWGFNQQNYWSQLTSDVGNWSKPSKPSKPRNADCSCSDFFNLLLLLVCIPHRDFIPTPPAFKDWDGFWLGISHLKVLAVEYSIPTRANIVAKMANLTWVLLLLDACYSRG